MKSLLCLSIILLLFSCAENKSPANSIGTIKDTIRLAPKPDETVSREFLVERGRFEDARYKVIAYSRFIIPGNLEHDSSFYLEGNMLTVSEKRTNQALKIELTNPCSFDNRVVVSDVTKALGLKETLFEVTTPDCSDWYISEFISVHGGRIKKLFDLSDSQPAVLERTNEGTLSGFVKSADEVVGAFQDYPISVSLKDFTVTMEKPLKQSLGFSTEALETFKLSGHGADHTTRTYTIKEGEKLTVDSIFRDTKQVRLIVKDSIPLYCPISDLEGKIQGNTAG